MSAQEYLDKMKNFQEMLLEFLDRDANIEDSFIEFTFQLTNLFFIEYTYFLIIY